MRRLLEAPGRLLENGAIDAFTAQRDWLLLELLYGGGLRVSELVALSFGQIDVDSGVARIMGKGRKERVCPLGEAAMTLLRAWRDGLRAGVSAGAADLAPLSSVIPSAAARSIPRDRSQEDTSSADRCAAAVSTAFCAGVTRIAMRSVRRSGAGAASSVFEGGIAPFYPPHPDASTHRTANVRTVCDSCAYIRHTLRITRREDRP
jgi:hypothetical protein